MSAVERLGRELAAHFPNADIEIRKSDDPNGFQFLNMFIEDFEVGVEWKREHGFGISSFRGDSPSPENVFDSPNEWYETEQAAFHRIASLVFDQRCTKPRQAKGIHYFAPTFGLNGG